MERSEVGRGRGEGEGGRGERRREEDDEDDALFVLRLLEDEGDALAAEAQHGLQTTKTRGGEAGVQRRVCGREIVHRE